MIFGSNVKPRTEAKFKSSVRAVPMPDEMVRKAGKKSAVEIKEPAKPAYRKSGGMKFLKNLQKMTGEDNVVYNGVRTTVCENLCRKEAGNERTKKTGNRIQWKRLAGKNDRFDKMIQCVKELNEKILNDKSLDKGLLKHAAKNNEKVVEVGIVVDCKEAKFIFV